MIPIRSMKGQNLYLNFFVLLQRDQHQDLQEHHMNHNSGTENILILFPAERILWIVFAVSDMYGGKY